MSSKELQKELVQFYDRGITCKITAVPDGCYIYTPFETGGQKIFIGVHDFKNDKNYVLNVYLQEVDNRLQT